MSENNRKNSSDWSLRFRYFLPYISIIYIITPSLPFIVGPVWLFVSWTITKNNKRSRLHVFQALILVLLVLAMSVIDLNIFSSKQMALIIPQLIVLAVHVTTMIATLFDKDIYLPGITELSEWPARRFKPSQ